MAARPELFFGIVGAIGSDIEMVSKLLEEALATVGYAHHAIKLTEYLPKNLGEDVANSDKYLRYKARMKAGTLYREQLGQGDAVALLGINQIASIREELGASQDNADELPGMVVSEDLVERGAKTEQRSGSLNESATNYDATVAGREIDEKEKNEGESPPKPLAESAFIINQLKHPLEVKTLRETYGDLFYLIGCYAPREVRINSLAKSIAHSRYEFQAEQFRREAEELAEIDRSEAGNPFGQKVQETFPLADVFVNCADMALARKSIFRFIELLFGNPFHSPTLVEHAMFHAKASALKSADLGRQVGAVLCSPTGEVIGTGCNEVPKAKGGQYSEDDLQGRRDKEIGYDSNARAQINLLRDLLKRLQKGENKDEEHDPTKSWLNAKSDNEIDELVSKTFSDEKSFLSRSQLTSVIAYFRAVHAEMACITDAARRGISTQSATMVCTTFPCHECARHIVCAGIMKLVYIDPYPKSLAPDLYPDSIAVDDTTDINLVHFIPFVGIAPRLYMRLFDFSEIDRKHSDGTKRVWLSESSSPRVLNSGGYIQQEYILLALLERYNKKNNEPPPEVKESGKRGTA